jgi:hypothetical protein
VYKSWENTAKEPTLSFLVHTCDCSIQKDSAYGPVSRVFNWRFITSSFLTELLARTWTWSLAPFPSCWAFCLQAQSPNFLIPYLVYLVWPALFWITLLVLTIWELTLNQRHSCLSQDISGTFQELGQRPAKFFVYIQYVCAIYISIYIYICIAISTYIYIYSSHSSVFTVMAKDLT